MFIPFLYELRARKVPVGTQEAVALADALAKGLHDSSLEGFYFAARALLVHSERHLDDFDQAFSKHFRGIEVEAKKITDELLDWLKDPRHLRDHRRGAGDGRALDLGSCGAASRSACAAEGAPRRRQPLERHRRHLAVRRAGFHPGARGGGGSAAAAPPCHRRRTQVPAVPQRPGARHRQNGSRSESCAASRARAPIASGTSRRPSTAPQDAGELEVSPVPRAAEHARHLMRTWVADGPYAHLASSSSAPPSAPRTARARTYYFHNWLREGLKTEGFQTRFPSPSCCASATRATAGWSATRRWPLRAVGAAAGVTRRGAGHRLADGPARPRSSARCG